MLTLDPAKVMPMWCPTTRTYFGLSTSEPSWQEHLDFLVGERQLFVFFQHSTAFTYPLSLVRGTA